MIALALFSILAGPANETLMKYADQSRVGILYGIEVVEGIETNPVEGDYDPQSALALMLAGTSVEIRWLSANEVTLKIPEPPYADERWEYACVPTKWVAGIIFNRLGRLLFDMGEIPRDMQFCTPERPLSPRPQNTTAARSLSPLSTADTDSRPE